MLKFLIWVLCFLNCVFIVISFPIIKSSGVQWSEPKGAGKGNITLIMIPQENTGCNDSDMLVAVKSDYQIMSQDLQLINLVVNENQPNTTNASKLNTEEQKCDDLSNITAQQLNNNKINCINTANYFQSDKNSALNGLQNNNSIVELPASLITEKRYTMNAVTGTVTDSSNFNILKFLGMTESNNENIYKNNNESGFSNIFSTNVMDGLNLLKLLNLSESSNNGSFMNDMKSNKEGINTSPASSQTKTNNAFVNDALNILPKIIQNPTYKNNENSNFNTNEELGNEGETMLHGSKTKTLNSEDLELTSDDDDSLAGIEYPGPNKNDKSNLEGNSIDVNRLTTPTTECLPMFYPFNNQNDISGTPSSSTSILLTNEVSHTTQSTSDQNVVSFKSVSAIPQGANQNTINQGYMSIEETNRAPNTEMCTTIIMKCNQANENGVFDQISQMIESNNDKTDEHSTELSMENNTKNGFGITDSDLTECFTINAMQVSGQPQAAKQELPKKITMEPPIDCETQLKLRGYQTSAAAINENNIKVNGKDLTLPLVESSVFLANNKEMPKGGDIPIVLNTSLDELSLTDLQEKNDHVNGEAAELYNNNQAMYNLKDGILEDTHSKPLALKRNDKRRILLKTKNIGKNKIFYPDLSGILKMKLAGRNIILEQRQPYRSGMPNDPCKSTPNTDVDPLSLEMEPDNNENIDSQLTTTGRITNQRTSEVDILTTLKSFKKPTKQSDSTQGTDSSKLLESIVTSVVGKETINEMVSYENGTEEENLQSDQTLVYYDSTNSMRTTTKRFYSDPENQNFTLLKSSTLKSDSPLVTHKSVNKNILTTKSVFMTSSIDDEHYTSDFKGPISKTAKTTTSTIDESENPSEKDNMQSIDRKDLTLNSCSSTRFKTSSTYTYKRKSETSLDKNPTIKTVCITVTSDNENYMLEDILSTTTETMILDSHILLDNTPTTAEDLISSTNEDVTTSSCQQSVKTTGKRTVTNRKTSIITDSQQASKPTDHSSLMSHKMLLLNPNEDVSTAEQLNTDDLFHLTTHKPDQNQHGKNVYIPADSVKEIVIQIIRNTKKPDKSDAPKSYSNTQDNKESFILPEDEKESGTLQRKQLSQNTMYNKNEANKEMFVAHEREGKMGSYQRKLTSPKKMLNDNEINIIYLPTNGLDNKSYNYNKQSSKSKTNLGGHVQLGDVNQINDLLFENTLSNKELLQQKFDDHYKPSKTIMNKEKSLASNILKLLLTDKPPINNL